MTLPTFTPRVHTTAGASVLRALFARLRPAPAVSSRESIIAGHLTEFSSLVESGRRDAALAKWTQLRDEPMIRIAMIARLRASGVDIEAFMKPARAQTMREAAMERQVAELVGDLAS